MSKDDELRSAKRELEANRDELRSLNHELTTLNAELRERIEQLEREERLRKRELKLLAMELGVARIVTDEPNRNKALKQAVSCMAVELGANLGAVWWGTKESARLVHQTLYIDKSLRADDAGHWVAAIRGHGLIGAAFKQGAHWTSDLDDRALYLDGDDNQSADSLGLVSGVVLPISANDQIVGVIAMFSSQRLTADDAFLRNLDSVGAAIGEQLMRHELERRALRLAAITTSSHDAILSYDLEGTIVEWLPGAEELFGYSSSEMVGKSIEKIVPDPLRQELWAVNKRILQGEVVEPFETSRIRKDGAVIPVSVRSSAVVDRSGAMIGISSTDRDITRRKQTERRLRQADRQKDEFMAMLGHELRNPLAAIRTATALLQQTAGSDPLVERTHRVLERQSAHMAKLLDGLLDVSRIIRGKIRLDLQIVDIVEICRNVAADAKSRLSDTGVDLQVRLPSDPLWIEADPVRITQIVDNLLSNAVKYTEAGAITVELERDRGEALLTVSDTGVGIEPELLDQIFDEFRQSKQSLDRAQGGLGLGLALVRSLVEMHHGTVEANSDGIDKGSVFTVRLGLSNKRPVSDIPSKAVSERLQILIVEDNEDSAEMLRQLLELDGHEVQVANRAQDGIEIAKRQPPDVVLCDIGLPDGMSGFDVAEMLRADSRIDKTLLVALTGYGSPADQERSTKSGFDLHLTKPIDLESIQRVLADVSGRLRE